MNLMKYTLFRLVIVFFVSFSSFSWSTSLTVSQLNQFKQLSPEQQQTLARQYGVELSTLVGPKKDSKEPPAIQTIQPRDIDTKQKKDDPAQKIESEEKDDSEQLVDFGYDLFAGHPFSYTPVDDLPVPNNYLIAAGDEIQVQIFGSQNNSYSLNVSRDGSIQFPNLGPIYVAGQTFSELKENLKKRINKQILGAELSISLGSLRMIQIYVAGDVYQPGAYNIPSLATVTQALIAAGGFSKSGSLRNIIVRRQNKVIAQLDLYHLLLEGNKLNDIRLQSGDTVFVAAKGPSVRIQGEVLRPAIYEIKPNTTIKKLVNIAGGNKASAYLLQVQVKRYQKNGIHVYTLDLTKDKDNKFVIKGGDDITIHPVSDVLKRAVIVRGAAIRQGAYAYHQDMKVSDLFSSIDDLAPNADLDYAIVVRETGHKHNIKVLQLSLNNAINNVGSPDDIILKSDDQLFVFSTDISLNQWKMESVEKQSSESKNLFTNTEKQKISKKHSKKRDALTGIELVDSEKPKLTEQSGEKERKYTKKAHPYSRARLLAPLITRLKRQAVNEHKVKIYEVSGAVRYPGVYPLVEEGSLKDAITAAGGLLESAARDRAELSRVVRMPSTITIHHHQFDLMKSLTNQKDNFLIESKDLIVVQRKTNWKTNNIVEIQGEVMHPGSYTINQGETINDLVRRAGGLSQFAYPQGAVFSREVLRLQEQQRMKMVTNNLRQEIASLALRRQSSAATYTSSPTEAMKVVDDLLDIPAIGRLVINLPDIILGNAQDDVMLEDGDKLYIPPRRNTISVLGQVQIASNFTFKPGLSVDKYINLAGGEKKQADTDRVYVIRANGAVMLPNQSHWFVRAERPLEPGDTIVVPIDTDYLDGLSTMSTATQMMYQIGVAWNAIK